MLRPQLRRDINAALIEHDLLGALHPQLATDLAKRGTGRSVPAHGIGEPAERFQIVVGPPRQFGHPKVEAQAEAVAKRSGFASLAEYDDAMSLPNRSRRKSAALKADKSVRGRSKPLRHDALEAELAGVFENDVAGLGDVFIELQRPAGLAQQLSRSRLRSSRVEGTPPSRSIRPRI
jgi:hypothetical protein